ncbi:MAG: N-acetyltransferase [Acidobacteriia bacterium]|nr:N-acetyltransferase [Terriglobia bacterium]
MHNDASPRFSSQKPPQALPEFAIRGARLSDAAAIQSIIETYARQRLMLPRSLMQIYENVRDYWVAVDDGSVVGVGALHCFWEDLVELRALAVAPVYKDLGLGRHIVLHLIAEARTMGASTVFAFTYIPQFFSKFGFEQVPHHSLPLKVWKDCINCSFFNNCNEIAMIKRL